MLGPSAALREQQGRLIINISSGAGVFTVGDARTLPPASGRHPFEVDQL
jgi:hypothetical protein